MPAATAKKPTKTSSSKSPKGALSSVNRRLSSVQVLAWLQRNPNFFEDNKDSLSTLSIPKKGGNILSLHAAKAERSASEHARLAIRQKQLIAMAQNNAVVADTLLTAMVGLIPVASLAELRTYIQTTLRKGLDLSATKLYLVGKTDPATTLTIDTINTLAPQPATLRSLSLEQAESLYGPIGKKLKSDCLLPLYTTVKGKQKCLGLLALGSDDATRFHAGQATTMASTFGEAISGCVQRITAKK